MSAKRSRENKKPLTFWIDNDLKKRAQEKSREIGYTLTDLINRAIEIYLVKGAELENDAEWKKKLIAANISTSIKESGISYEKLEKIDSSMESLFARLKVLEDKYVTPDTYTNELKKLVQLEINSKVTPILEQLATLMRQFDNN